MHLHGGGDVLGVGAASGEFALDGSHHVGELANDGATAEGVGYGVGDGDVLHFAYLSLYLMATLYTRCPDLSRGFGKKNKIIFYSILANNYAWASVLA